MNKERILALADIIEKQPHAQSFNATAGFGMADYFHTCGTPSCIAGWASALAVNEFSRGAFEKAKKASRSDKGNWVDLFPAGYLGLEPDQRSSLFGMTDDDITPAHAAAVLRNLAETGEVDWSVTAPVEA